MVWSTWIRRKGWDSVVILWTKRRGHFCILCRCLLWTAP